MSFCESQCQFYWIKVRYHNQIEYEIRVGHLNISLISYSYTYSSMRNRGPPDIKFCVWVFKCEMIKTCSNG